MSLAMKTKWYKIIFNLRYEYKKLVWNTSYCREPISFLLEMSKDFVSCIKQRHGNTIWNQYYKFLIKAEIFLKYYWYNWSLYNPLSADGQ